MPEMKSLKLPGYDEPFKVMDAEARERIGKLEEKADDYAQKGDIPAPYTLPTASADVKGGVMIGKGLELVGDVLSVDDGEYELISLIEITEPVPKVVIDGFLLKEGLLTVFIPRSDETNTLACLIYTETGESMYFSVSNAQQTSSERYTRAYFSVQNKLLRITTTQPASTEINSTSAGQVGFRTTNGGINKVEPYMGSSKEFPTGTWIKVEGVRANA